MRANKSGVVEYVSRGSISSLLTVPVIYSLLVPFVLLDLWVSAYEAICFPIYGIARVPRDRDLVADRYRLPYLNWIERVNCVFCSYANGLIGFVREVAARTEQYWCPIKHARPPAFRHRHYRAFVAFGDARGYAARLPALRRAVAPRRTRSRRSIHRERVDGRRPR